MQSNLVVPKQPRDGLFSGVAPSHIALPEKALDLQQAQKRLSAGISPPVAASAHETGDDLFHVRVPDGAIGVLAAPITVKQQHGTLV